MRCQYCQSQSGHTTWCGLGPPPRPPVFATEDGFVAFVNTLSKHEMNALYEVLHAHGCRYRGDAVTMWARSRRRD